MRVLPVAEGPPSAHPQRGGNDQEDEDRKPQQKGTEASHRFGVKNRVLLYFYAGFLGVQLGSQAAGVYGSFGKCELAWTFRTVRGRVPHSGRRYAKYPNQLTHAACNRPDGLVVLQPRHQTMIHNLEDACFCLMAAFAHRLRIRLIWRLLLIPSPLPGPLARSAIVPAVATARGCPVQRRLHGVYPIKGTSSSWRERERAGHS
jgi:hypothetical protein